MGEGLARMTELNVAYDLLRAEPAGRSRVTVGPPPRRPGARRLAAGGHPPGARAGAAQRARARRADRPRHPRRDVGVPEHAARRHRPPAAVGARRRRRQPRAVPALPRRRARRARTDVAAPLAVAAARPAALRSAALDVLGPAPCDGGRDRRPRPSARPAGAARLTLPRLGPMRSAASASLTVNGGAMQRTELYPEPGARPTRRWAVASGGHRRTLASHARGLAGAGRRRSSAGGRGTRAAPRSRFAPLQRAHAPTVLIQPWTVPMPRAERDRGSTWSTVPERRRAAVRARVASQQRLPRLVVALAVLAQRRAARHAGAERRARVVAQEVVGEGVEVGHGSGRGSRSRDHGRQERTRLDPLLPRDGRLGDAPQGLLHAHRVVRPACRGEGLRAPPP